MDASERGIADLAGIEHLTNLTELELGLNHISDISPLASLTNLSRLVLWHNQISDISPLASLTNLTDHLNLGANQISDISPLASLTNLTNYLGLGANQISDIAPLASLSNLTFLVLDENRISDLSTLLSLSNLTEVFLSANPISDISLLASLTNLTSLSLSGIQISDISPLASLTNLTSLSLFENQISDISPLASLTNLTNLYAGFNQISDISPLASLSNLTELFLPHNQISDVSPLGSLTKLSKVRLGENQISDISPLVENSGLGRRDEVVLEHNPLDLSEGSEDLENLRKLEERGVRVIPPTPARTPTATLITTPTPLAPEAARPLGTIQPVADEDCTGPFGDRCIRIIVNCAGIADATARLRVTGTGTKGTIVLTVGGRGTDWYRVEGESREGDNINGMMDTLLADGYRLVEVRWVEPGIWEGPGGSISLACRSASVFYGVYENIHQGGFFAAQGNSGGSAQIAFALAYYGVDEILDLANLSGGPPPCPISTHGEINFEEQLRCLVEAELWERIKRADAIRQPATPLSKNHRSILPWGS